MAHPIFFLFLSLLLIPATTHLQSNGEGYISLLLSNKGMDFVKDALLTKAVSSIIPLPIQDIKKSVKIPLVGKVHMVLSDITVDSVSIPSSYVETGEKGLVLVASRATANLSMRWSYSYSTWIVVISDSGAASVQVTGMEVGLTAALNEQEGNLKLSLLDCGCHVKDISIKLDGGASWLYQGLVGAFEGSIGSAVEDAISKKIKEEIVKLDSRLQSLPKQIRVDHVAALNVTFMDNPVLSNSSIELEIDGLFVSANNAVVPKYLHHEGNQAPVSCKDSAKMIGLSLHENVFNTAAQLYFNAGYMHWTVDKFLNQSLLNTAAWRYIYPQLYKQYPDDDMNVNLSVTSPPVVKISARDIDATMRLDVTVNVLDAGEIIPVACISLVISTSCSPKIIRSNLAGFLKLKNLSVSLKWSKIGNLHMLLVQPAMFTLIKTVFIPYLNLHLLKGFPLPLIHGFALCNAEIECTDSKLNICSNLAFT